MRSGGSPVMSSPSKTMRPPLGLSTPVRQLKKVDLPAPLGPMIARISPRATRIEALLRAVNPPNRMVSCSVRRIDASSVTLGELAGWREHRLLARNRLEEAVLPVLDVEDELPDERLVVFLAKDTAALREVVTLLHLETFERLDELHAVVASLEA